MTVQLNRAQAFVDAQVATLASRMCELLGNSPLTGSDWELVAREVKKYMKQHYGMNEIMLVLWGTRFTMLDVSDGPASSPEWERVWMEHGAIPSFRLRSVISASSPTASCVSKF